MRKHASKTIAGGVDASAALLLLCGLLLAALPAGAELYTIRLANGTTFESRYQPKQAAWDKTLVTFVDETGTEISLPQALIADVAADSEAKGFGRVINTSTVDLGFAPNDVNETERMKEMQAGIYGSGPINLAQRANSQQFVEPNQIGGIPLAYGGYGGGVGGVGTPGQPAAPPTGITTPAPFTTPTIPSAPATPTAPTAPPSTPQ